MVYSVLSVAGAVSFPIAMQSRDWDELQRLMSIARQQNLLGEALQCVEQAPLTPIPRAVAKAKAMAATTSVLGVAGSVGTDGSSAGVVIGGMTDASKRRLPEDSDWEPIDGSETLSTSAQVAEFLAENNVVPVPWMPGGGEIHTNTHLDQWYPALDYDGGDTRMPLPKGVASYRDWGRTIVTMAKFANGTSTFEDMVRMALGGSPEHIKYLCFIKEKFKAKISTEPASQGPDLCAFLHFIRFEPPPMVSCGYQRTYR